MLTYVDDLPLLFPVLAASSAWAPKEEVALCCCRRVDIVDRNAQLTLWDLTLAKLLGEGCAQCPPLQVKTTEILAVGQVQVESKACIARGCQSGVL